MSLLKDVSTLPKTVAPPVEVKPVEVSTRSGLIKEFTNVQTALKTSDATDAGKSDVSDKAVATNDVGFSLMRNTINASGQVTGSDVADYIERAEELNDEVDTVPFGLETDDGQIVKVYVNAEQADKFEEAMKNMLGLEDDIEEAINRLTTEFDIVDVVWPKSDDDLDGDGDPDQDLSIDDTSNLEDPEDDADFADDQYDVIAGGDTPEADASGKPKAAADEEPDEEPTEEEPEDEDTPAEEDPDAEEGDPDDDPDKPKKKKKRKSAQPAEPAEGEVKESKDPRDEEADSPSTAAAVKLMTSKGLHIAAMKEAPGNVVYIEDSQGDEYVLRGDDKLTKEKHGKKLMSLKKEEFTQEKEMTIGSKFLNRVLAEAEGGEDRDGVKDGFNIPLDSQARAMAAKLKLPFAKRLIAFHFMCGVPGRYMNTADVSEAVAGAADMLRKKVAIRRAFTTLYEGLAAAKGFTIPADGVQEAKSDAKRLAGQSAEKQIKARDELKKAKKALADHLKTYDGGTGAREKALRAEIDKVQAKLKKLTEEEDVAIFEATKNKRGGFIQKLLESVLTQLGLPEALITVTGPSAVGTGIYRTAELIEQDSTLERSLRLLATRMGIRGSDAQKPVEEGIARNLPEEGWFIVSANGGALDGPFKTEKAAQKEADMRDDKAVVKYGKAVGISFKALKEPVTEENLDEVVDVGNDDYAQAVTGLVDALGIPADILERRRTQVVQSLRKKKQTIRNRAQVLTMITRLMGILEKNTVEPNANQQPAPGETNEAASRWTHLSALQEASLKAFKLTIPDGTELSKLKGDALHDAIFGEDEGDNSFIMNQTAVTVEYISVKGKTVYVYPHFEEIDEADGKKLQTQFNRWAEEFEITNESLQEAPAAEGTPEQAAKKIYARIKNEKDLNPQTVRALVKKQTDLLGDHKFSLVAGLVTDMLDEKGLL